ncbi:MAG: outer membrane beta-barrel family protein, partial [Saprospiraceae bacterium]
WPSYALNGNFKHTFPKGHQELSVDVDYADYWNNTTQLFTTKYYDLEGNENLPEYLLYGDLQGDLDIKSAKADFVYPITKDLKFEAGVKASVVGADNDVQFFDKSDIDHPVFDSTISNHFIYKEKINAAYINLSRNWAKFSIQSGLRAENTIAEGIQLINGQSFDRNYINLFPSVFLNYNFSDHYSMGLNMSRRLDRPSYQQLNPFKYYLDPSTYREGDPFLNPQFTWSFEWNHTFFQRFTATLSYALTTDNITQVIAPVEGLERVTVQTDKNLDNVEYYSFSASAPITIGKWWNNTINFDAYIGKYKGNYANTNLSDGNLVFNFVTNNSFTFGKGWSAELNFNYHTREIYAFMDLNPMWGLGTGVQKMLFKNRATLKFAVSDIFWQNLPSAFIKYRDYQETFEVFRETRQASITYTQRFGDKQLSPSRRRVGGAEDEKQRAGAGSQG